MNNPRRIQRHLAKAVAAGALLAAAALPLAFATAAGADTITSVSFVPSGIVTSSFGEGASGTFDLVGTFAGDGGNTTVTTTAPGVTFTVLTNTNGTDITGDFASTSASAPGSYPITATDNAGTVTAAGAFTINGPPSATSVSPSSGSDTVGDTPIAVTVTGSGFVGDPVNPTVALTSTVDGTSITGTVTGVTGGTTLAPVTTMTVSITPENPINFAPATPGTYTMTVTNPDGGTTTSGPIFTIIGNEISTVSPSALPNAVGAYAVTILGGGFQSGTTVAYDAGSNANCSADTTISGVTVSSASTITLTVSVPTTAPGSVLCGFEVTNTGGNLASFDAANALGFGTMGGELPPMITASSLTTGTALLAGAPSTTIALTGEGFSPNSTPELSGYGTGDTADAAATITGPCIANSAGTSLTCAIGIPNDEVAGPHFANVENHSGVLGSEGVFANAFTADGPAVTSAAPPALATGAAIGTIVALTGTEFTNTTSGSTVLPFVNGVKLVGAGNLKGSFQFVSATTENFVVTGSPVQATTVTFCKSARSTPTATLNFQPIALGIDPSPTVSSVTYATGTSGVGVGATAQTITINGTGFQTGATVTAFTNGAAAADAAVTAKVTAVNNLGTRSRRP